MMNSIHNDDKFEVPDGAELLSTQVAGHRFGKCRNKFGLLKHTQSGDILKPVYDERGIREQKFYESVFDHSKDHDVCIVKFRLLIPQYNGLFNDTRMNNKYIRLQSATANMRNPSLLDVKIGAKTYDPHATEEKRKSEKNKYRYALEIGFRILGMKVYDRTTKTYIEKDKEYGLTVTPQNASEAWLTFTNHDVILLKEFHQQLCIIEDWFRNFNIDKWKFISSSLLFVYDERPIMPTNQCQMTNNNCDNTSGNVVVKMIDFAHVFNNEGIDNNYLFGLTKLIKYIQQTLDLSFTS